MEEIFVFVMRTTLCLAVFFCFCAVSIPVPLMKIFTNDPILISHGAAYLKVVGISYTFSGASQIYLCIIKNTGKADGIPLCKKYFLFEIGTLEKKILKAGFSGYFQ